MIEKQERSKIALVFWSLRQCVDSLRAWDRVPCGSRNYFEFDEG